MSLEAKIAELTLSVGRLTTLAGAMLDLMAKAQGLEIIRDVTPQKAVAIAESVSSAVDKEITIAEVAATAQAMADAVVVEVPNASPKSGEPSAPVPEQSSPKAAYDDVKRATNNLSAAKGKEVTIAALARFGVKRATELTREQWAPYIDYAGKATSGDVDPLGVA